MWFLSQTCDHKELNDGSQVCMSKCMYSETKPEKTPQRSRLTLITNLQHALYHPGLLGVLGTGSEEIIHKGTIYKA